MMLFLQHAFNIVNNFFLIKAEIYQKNEMNIKRLRENFAMLIMVVEKRGRTSFKKKTPNLLGSVWCVFSG